MKEGSAEKGCRIEEKEQRSEEKHYVRLGERILEDEGRMLAATGSLSCLRALYMTAERIKALDRFRFCILSEAEYATGQAEYRLQDMIRQAIREQTCDGMIIYASCLEIITRLDFRHLMKGIENPGKVPVRMLYRGPMVRRYRNPPEELEQILCEMPSSGQSAGGGAVLLPPPMPDFEAVSGVLQRYPVYRILVSGGGCDGCIENSPLCGENYRLRKTRLNDLEVAAGCEEAICEGIRRDWLACGQGELCCILGSGMPAAVGMDFRRICVGLEKEGIRTRLFSTDGFHSAQEGLGSMYRKLAEQAQPVQEELGDRHERKTSCLGILGAHLYAAASREKIAHALEHLQRDGFAYVFPEDDIPQRRPDQPRVTANWVVTAEGIPAAEYMRVTLDIPWYAGVPVGMHAMLRWRTETARLLGGDTGDIPEIPAPVPARPDAPAVLLEGDPVLTEGIASWLRDMCGIQKIIRAVYAPVKTQAAWYQNILHQADTVIPCGRFGDVRYFVDGKTWEQLAEKADVIIADAVLQCSLPESLLKKKRWVDLPNPVLSHGIRTEYPLYTVFGKKGAAYLASEAGQGVFL